MNNWLGFSLSPQELPPSQPHQSSTLISGDEVSADCYGLSTDPTSAPPLGIPALRPDGSFGILEALNRPNSHPQDWSMKSLDFKGSSSELSILVGSSSNQNNMDHDEPKLEDFLGGNSFSDHDQKLPPGCSSIPGTYDNSGDYMFSNCSLQLPAAASMASNGGNNGGLMNNNGTGASSSNSIGLSMIKTWLRNQPAPLHHPEGNNNMDSTGTSNCGGGALEGGVGGPMASSQSLSLSMSTGSQSSSALPLLAAAASGGGESSSSENKQKGSGSSLDGQSGAIEAVPRKSIDTFGQRTSIYRGVTRFDAPSTEYFTSSMLLHLDIDGLEGMRPIYGITVAEEKVKLVRADKIYNSRILHFGLTFSPLSLFLPGHCHILRKYWVLFQLTVYLGGYDKEEKAARAYDLAALKYWGPTTTTNFPISNYEKELEEMKHMTRQEYVASLRRKSSGFSRGASIYRGVTRHHQHGRWQARIGRVAGNKDLYLGTFSTQEEAAEAYDIAAIKFRGLNAVTNFDMSRYDVKSILESSTLPIGGAAKRLKDVSEHTEASVDGRRTDDDNLTSQLTDGISSSYASHAHHHGWPPFAFPQAQPLPMHYPYGQQRGWCKQEQDSVMATAHTLQDLQQLHLGNNTHNFFQPSMIHNLISMDSSSMEHSTGSNSVVYNGSMAGSSGSYPGVVGGSGRYALPVSAMVADQSQGHQGSSSFGENEGKAIGYENMLGSTDPYGGRTVYYLSQQSSGGVVKDNGYDQSGGCNTWMQPSVQAIAARANNVAVCHGAPLFPVWDNAN
ncbi:AP2-like ethylene-responsive transcription factor BBM2 [Cocos nucifera]|uniref:AP2-like ethylene-responsive transcription factor BBM2 n=1 Tax=Cocos nucifera TaxID=13894 RepID=A0A8K0I0K7_COCNU|nr:AP2-like ethylene-responsive transcription factor BBM2 [Cocos nucifera]